MKSRDWAEIGLGCFTAVYAVVAVYWALEAVVAGLLSGAFGIFEEFRVSMMIGMLNILLRPALAFLLLAYLRRRAVARLSLSEAELTQGEGRVGVELMIAALIGYGAWQVPIAVYGLLQVLGKIRFGYEEIPEKADVQWTIPANQEALIGSVASFCFALAFMFWARPIALWVLPKKRPVSLSPEY